MEGQVRERSPTELVGELLADVQRLVRDEVELARVELRQTIQDAALGLGAVAVAGMLALLAVAFIGVAIFFALALVIPPWAAGLTVFGIYAIATAIVGSAAYQSLRSSNLSGQNRRSSLFRRTGNG